MVKESRNRHSLLLAAAQRVFPIAHQVEAVADGDVLEGHHSQDLAELFFAHILVSHVFQRVRVDDLLTEASDGHVRSLEMEFE